MDNGRYKKIMEIWNSDSLEGFSSKFGIILGEGEDLPKQINELEIIRGENFSIQMVARSHANDRPERKQIPLGLVYRLDNSVAISGYVGSGIIRSYSQTNVSIKTLSPNQDTATAATYSIAEIEYASSDSEVNYTIDQVANLPEHYIWCHRSESKKQASMKLLSRDSLR